MLNLSGKYFYFINIEKAHQNDGLPPFYAIFRFYNDFN